MRMRPSSPELRPTWWDGLAAAIVAALAIFTAVWYYGGLARSGPLTAAIVHRGQVVQTVELDRLTEEMTVTVEGADEEEAAALLRRFFQARRSTEEGGTP